jgi:hypothetical protein
MHTLDGFKKFTHKGRSTNPKAVIRKNGQMGFNSGAIGKYNLDIFKFVILYISENKKDRIAIKFTNNDKESGLVKIQKRSGSFAFSAITFLNFNDIDYSETTNYDFIWLEAEKTAIFKPKKRLDNAI